VANPYPTGTFTPQDATSFARREMALTLAFSGHREHERALGRAIQFGRLGWTHYVKPNNAAQGCTAILIGQWSRRIGPGEQELRPVVMASVCVLGFISLSPTYQDRQVSAIQIRPHFSWVQFTFNLTRSGLASAS
jgi:hypothetical protein